MLNVSEVKERVGATLHQDTLVERSSTSSCGSSLPLAGFLDVRRRPLPGAFNLACRWNTWHLEDGRSKMSIAHPLSQMVGLVLYYLLYDSSWTRARGRRKTNG